MLVLDKMTTMVLLLAVGVTAAKAGLVDEQTNRRLSRYTLAIPQSAMILNSALNLQMEMTVGKVLEVLGLGLLMHGLLLALSFLLPRVFRAGEEDRGLYSFLITFGNTAYMGMPLAGAIYGSDAVFYAALVCLPFNLLVFTVGVRMISGGKNGGGFDWHAFISPAMISSAAAIVLVFLPVSWPVPVRDAVSSLGGVVLPLSMTIVGASLGAQRLRDVFRDWRAYAVAPVRLLLAPVLLWAVMRLFVHDSMLLGVITLLAGMPAAALSVMLSIRYGRSEALATRAVILTTVLSVGTIPLICWLLL